MNPDKFVVFGTAFFAVALVSVAYFSEPPKRPAPKNPCVQIDVLRDRITARSRDFHNFRAVALRYLEAATSFYNALPPPSKVEWESAYLVDGPSGSGALIVAIGGNACGLIVLSAEHYSALLRAIEPQS